VVVHFTWSTEPISCDTVFVALMAASTNPCPALGSLILVSPWFPPTSGPNSSPSSLPGAASVVGEDLNFLDVFDMAGGLKTSYKVTWKRHLKSLCTFGCFMHYFIIHFHITLVSGWWMANWQYIMEWFEYVKSNPCNNVSPVSCGLKPLQQSLYRG
jgi:hypothetical protein